MNRLMTFTSLTQPPLEAHSLTVTRLRFSPNDQHLLSVSRDRQCGVWTCTSGGSYAILSGTLTKAHTRMVLDATWLSDTAFATAGRDKNVNLWQLNSDNCTVSRMSTIEADHPVTAIDCSRAGILAYGLENGTIIVCSVSSPSPTTIEGIATLGPNIAPSLAVTQLAWRPGYDNMLAASSEDASVRIYRIS